MSIPTFFKNLIKSITLWFGKVSWKPKNLLTIEEQKVISDLLAPNYYIILTRRNNCLSTYMIMLANFVVTGKFGYWDHALMNMEDTVINNIDFKLVEAVGTGVAYTTFDKVFDCNSVAILKSKHMDIKQWTAVLDKARTEVGKPYDTLFDLTKDNALSCVELVRTALMAETDYDTDFANFEALILKYRNLTPQMFYDCGDFEIVYEIRH